MRAPDPIGGSCTSPLQARRCSPPSCAIPVVSSKTVEVHLTRIYAKREVASRTELRVRARTGELEILDAQTAAED